VSLPVAILAGGLATRLRPLTETIPKALVEVAGRPFIDHQLALLRTQGYARVVLCVGHLGEMIERHVGDGARDGMRVRYVSDGPTLLGTGGALRRALPELGPAFLVLYGDSYLPCDFAAVERAFEAAALPALMTVLKNDNRWDRSNVIYEGGKVLRYDKKTRLDAMRYIDYGLSAIQAAVLQSRPDGEAFDLSDVFTALAEEGRLAGFEARQRFYEIGSPAGLAETDRYLAAHSPLRGMQ
jgi:NDP-sugar pyrophosphorylase family protein